MGVGISVVGHAPAKGHEVVSRHLQAALSGVLCALSEAAAGSVGSNLERTTWHLQMACNYLKIAASKTGTAEADAVDVVRERLTDRLFLLEGALLSVECGGSSTRVQGLLEGLELMVAIASLMPVSLTPLGPAPLPDAQTLDSPE